MGRGRPRKVAPADPKTLVFGTNGSTVIVARDVSAFRKAKASARMKKVDAKTARQSIGSTNFNIAMANAALPHVSVQQIPIAA